MRRLRGLRGKRLKVRRREGAPVAAEGEAAGPAAACGRSAAAAPAASAEAGGGIGRRWRGGCGGAGRGAAGAGAGARAGRAPIGIAIAIGARERRASPGLRANNGKPGRARSAIGVIGPCADRATAAERRDRDPRRRDDRPGSGRGASGRGREPARRPERKLYSVDSVVDRGFEDIEEEGGERRVHWTIVKRTVADQISRKAVSASYVLKRDDAESEFPSLGAARSAVNKTIVHPEKLTLSKADHAAAKSNSR